MSRTSLLRGAFAFAALAVLATCAPVHSERMELAKEYIPTPPKGAKWVQCPAHPGSGERQTKTIGPEGGTIALANGHALHVPAGAVGAPTVFNLREPETPEVLVIATSEGQQQFERPLELTVSWERCNGTVDPQTPRIFRREDMEDLGGKAAAASVTSDRLKHLSGYLVADG